MLLSLLLLSLYVIIIVIIIHYILLSGYAEYRNSLCSNYQSDTFFRKYKKTMYQENNYTYYSFYLLTSMYAIIPYILYSSFHGTIEGKLLKAAEETWSTYLRICEFVILKGVETLFKGFNDFYKVLIVFKGFWEL